MKPITILLAFICFCIPMLLAYPMAKAGYGNMGRTSALGGYSGSSYTRPYSPFYYFSRSTRYGSRYGTRGVGRGPGSGK